MAGLEMVQFNVPISSKLVANNSRWQPGLLSIKAFTCALAS